MPGRLGRVDNSSPSPNRIRNLPALTGSNVIAEIPAGGYFEVLAGPHCADNMAWFEIRTEDGVDGWMGEGTADGYWVMPIYTDPETLTGKQVTVPGFTLDLPPDFGMQAVLSRLPYEPETGLPPFNLVRFPEFASDGKTAVVYTYDVAEQLYYAADRRALLEKIRSEINALLKDPEAVVSAPAVLSWITPKGAPILAEAGSFKGGYGYHTIAWMAPTDGSRPAAPHYVFYGFTSDMLYMFYAAFEVQLTFGQPAQATIRDFMPLPQTFDMLFGWQALDRGAVVAEDGVPVTKCPGAPESYVKIGDWVRVSVDPPLPIRIRSGPGSSGDAIGEAEPGSNLFIIDGPECANGFAWWQVRSLDGLEGWTIEGDSDGYWLVEPISLWVRLPQPLDPNSWVMAELVELRLQVPGALRLPQDLALTYFPMATPVPTLAPNIWQDDPRETNHSEYRNYQFTSTSGGRIDFNLNAIPVVPELSINWEKYRDYARRIASMANSGSVLTGSLAPFLGWESYGLPVAITTKAEVIDFAGGSGIRYLVGTHNATPVMNPMYYIFQGVSEDGSLYLYLIIPVYSSYLSSNPNEASQPFGPFISSNDDPSFEKVQASYDVFNERIEELIQADELNFFPDLALLDAMVASIELK